MAVTAHWHFCHTTHPPSMGWVWLIAPAGVRRGFCDHWCLARHLEWLERQVLDVNDRRRVLVGAPGGAA